MEKITLPLVWVIIPTWNRCADVLACIASLKANDYPHVQIVVVDSASTDDTITRLQALHPDVALLPLPENRGAVGCNAGLRLAYAQGADYILRVDSDTTFERTFISELVNGMQHHTGAGMVVGKIFQPDPAGTLWSVGAIKTNFLYSTRELGRGQWDDGTFDVPRTVDYAWSCGFMLNRAAMAATNGFDDDFFVYYEEMDICERLRAAGFEIWYVPTAVMTHHVAVARPSARRAYQWNRGKMLFFRKHSRGLHRAILYLYAFSYAILRAIRPKQYAGNRGAFRHALRGLVAGLIYPLKR